MPIDTSSDFRKPPAGYYTCRFTGVTQRDGIGFSGEPVQKSVWSFVGHRIDDPEEQTFDLSVWVTNTFSPQSNQRKLMERMGGTSRRDEMGALEAVPAPVSLNDPRVEQLCATNCAEWEGEAFLVRVQDGTRADGTPTTFSNITDVWRAEGEPALLPSGPVAEGVLGKHASGRRVSKRIEGAVAAQSPEPTPPEVEDPFATE